VSEQQQSARRVVAEYMTRKVFTLRLDKRLIAAKEIMEWAHVRHVPVVNAAGAVVGMVSHRDLLAASIASVISRLSDVERKQHLWTVPIESVMCHPVTTISPTATVQDAARVMREGKIGCLPVVEQGKLVGIITDHDLLGLVEAL
jgi:CBS domain-containing membrane protein